MLVVGKAGELPFDVLDDASEVRAPIAGVVAGLRAAAHDVVGVPAGRLPARDAGGRARARRRVPRRGGPADRARCRARGRRRALPVLERRLATGPLALYRAYDELDVVDVQVDPALVADVDTPRPTCRRTSDSRARRVGDESRLAAVCRVRSRAARRQRCSSGSFFCAAQDDDRDPIATTTGTKIESATITCVHASAV